MELLMGLTDVTGSLNSPLQAEYLSEMQPPHLDSSYQHISIMSMSLNSSGEGSYSATLVATGWFNSELLETDCKACLADLVAGRQVEPLRSALVEVYSDLCSSMPD
eukprot:1456781-Rhodomonas_salina.5